MSELPDEHTPSFHIPIYDDLLKHLEVGALTVMLLGVILATFINILDRNFQLGIWDYAVVEKMVSRSSGLESSSEEPSNRICRSIFSLLIICPVLTWARNSSSKL